ncbi:MAG: TetR/AcrR family transcriptional regulator [Myxococcota bacterium]
MARSVPGTDPRGDPRTALLDAARARFVEQGVARASLAEIRAAAGVSNGSLFHWFPTKAHLARGVYLEALGAFQAAVLAALADDPPARRGVEALVRAHAAWVAAHPDRARVLAELRADTTVEGEPVDWAAANAEAFGALRAWLAPHVADGTVQDLPLGLFLALAFGPALQLTRAWTRRAPTDRTVDVLARAAWRAVATEEAAWTPQR